MTYFLDLFSGIGGFALAAYRAGLRFDGNYFSDIEPSAVKLYQKRFPDAVGLGDIKTINGGDLPKGDYIITGGFPCQDLSSSGKREGLDGERSGLYKEYIRIIGDLRPRFAIMENVAAIFGFDVGRLFGVLSEMGYDSEWAVIPASAIGANHKMERAWIIAYPQSKRWEAVVFQHIFDSESRIQKPEQWQSFLFITTGNYNIENWEKF